MQGVREIPLLSSLYLNRADDGFVFFDCGSYTQGLVTLSATEDNVMTTSLTLSAKSRLLLSNTLNAETKTSKVRTANVLHRDSFGDDGYSLTSKDFACTILESTPSDVAWNQQLQCSMSSPGQPWMLQRVQWESKGNGDNSFDFEPSGSIQTWTDVQASDATDGALTWTVGVLCPDTGCVKTVTRQYNENGMLSLVSLRTGRVDI